MKKILFLLTLTIFLSSCEVHKKLPSNAVILHQIIYIDEVQKGTPQTIQLPNGTVATYKMPNKIKDGELIKIPKIKGEPPYYIKIKLEKRRKNDKK